MQHDKNLAVLRISLLDLYIFMQVATMHSDQQVASYLGLDWQTVGRRLKALEESLDVQLFYRTDGRRQKRLTPAGQTLVEAARRMYEQWQKDVEAVRQAHKAEEDHGVRVGYTGTAVWSFLLDVINECDIAVPRIKVIHRDMQVKDQLLALRTHQLDVGFAINPEHDNHLCYKTMDSFMMMVALPENHRLARIEDAIPLKALADERWIWFLREANPLYHDENIQHCQEVGFTPRISHYSEQPFTIVSMVARGLGVALVTSRTKELRYSGVKYKPITPTWSMKLEMVWRKEEYRPIVFTFMKLACETVNLLFDDTF
jgi:DNA-binding transcriptional LysR family regulator